MAKTKIEWCDYSLNPVKGLCPMDCKDKQGKPYCYARRMYKRFKWNPEIRYKPEVFNDLWDLAIGSKIFVGSTIDLFYPKFYDYTENIIDLCGYHDKLTFQFLTKNPSQLSKFRFPSNCWVGVSATDTPSYQDAYRYLGEVEARVRFISFEPLLGAIYTQGMNHIPPYYNPRGFPFDWVIIGAQTPHSPKTSPRIEWVREIVEAADNAKIPVFLKDNLLPIGIPHDAKNLYKGEWSYNYHAIQLRQEMPIGV